MKIQKVVCPFLSLVILIGCSSSSSKVNPNPKQEVGETVRSIEVESSYMKFIQYPKTEYDILNLKVKDCIQQYERKFQQQVDRSNHEQKAEFNVTYESYFKDNRYVSIKLVIYENLYQKKEYIETFVYDSKTETLLTLFDIFDETEIQNLSNKVITHYRKQAKENCDNNRFRLHSSPIEENYRYFVLKKNAIVFYFPEATLFDNATSINFPYEDLEDAIDLKKESETTFVPYDQILNEPIKDIDPKKPMVALTFDDGPSKRHTTAILDALHENNASATFFVLGSNAINQAPLLQRMILEGNEIGNHTYSHKQLTTLSKENIEEEIIATQESIFDATHLYPKIIRPPYGSKNKTVMQCTQGKRLVSWTLDTRDWKDRNVKVIVERVMKKVKDGDIILMHDLYATSAQAAVILIPKLQDAGYQLVTVSDLYTYKKDVK